MKPARQVAHHLAAYDKICVWGAGDLGRAALADWFRDVNIAYVVDSTDAKQGTEIHGHIVSSPESLTDTSPDCIVICSTAYLAILEQIDGLGLGCPRFYIYQLLLPTQDSMSELDMLSIDLVANRFTWRSCLPMKRPQVLVNITYRLARHFRARKSAWPIYSAFAFLHYLACWSTSIELPLETEIGPGLIFVHPGTIVFSARARLGAFVSIYHCCTVGTTTSGLDPEIGDFCTIYTGSHVLGGCKLGNHTMVGAMSLALDVKTAGYCTLMGIPAQEGRRYASHLTPIPQEHGCLTSAPVGHIERVS
ncbi:MAG: hypothetical protein GKS00_02785 [Alphaproteobacteria bacterium]|nr:hypothetical protein [Alphaproteobacteria bacterium]